MFNENNLLIPYQNNVSLIPHIKEKDNIENLQALCRPCHINFGDKKQHMQFLRDIHELRLKVI